MFSPMAKAVMAATALSSASNIIAQCLEAYRDQKPFIFDIVKFLQFVLVTFIDAPPNYKWQEFLENRFPGYDRSSEQPSSLFDVEKQDQDDARQDENKNKKPSLNLRNTIAKTFIDCTFGAVFNTVAFFILMGFFKQQPLHQIWYNIRHETIGVIVAGYKIWPLASLISFSCVPMERRIVFLNFVNLIWGIYMSLVAARV
ncbi:hypothetical protein F4777DRAFT_566368 [Nemania sp. FL0916]|nr:hypothetical protein F4777DRAFT_566368 [Nemania sp. FL0916]